MNILRHRTLFLLGITILAAAASLYTDPDSGFSTILGGLAILQGVWAVAAAHYARKALTDYPEADQRTLFAKALESPTGAGLALIALSILMGFLLLVFAPRANAAALPDGYALYGPVLKTEQAHYWPDHPNPALLAALVEQESCVSLTHSKCWNPGARLKTAKEEGAGVGQLTRAFRADGSLRFDSLTELVNRYSADLTGLSWDTIYTRPDLQLRGLVLMSRDAAMPFRATSAMLEFGDAGYNGGISGVKKERRACQLTEGCDADQWFGHVELHCLKSRQPLYGNRSACDINRLHVYNVFTVRLARYEEVW